MEYTVNDLASKCRSKIEFYNILSRDGNIYLPPSQDANKKYLRSIMTGDKKYLTWDKVTVIKVPQYEGLTVKDILKFTKQNVDILNYIPEYKYDKDPNREWICNVVNSLVPLEFQEFVNIKVDQRKESIVKSQNLGTNVLPEFVSIFKSSNSVSLQKGKSHFLIRNPKETKQQMRLKEIEEEKVTTDRKLNACIKKLDEFASKIKELEEKQTDYDENIEKLAKLYELGVIDDQGNFINDKME